MQSMVQKYQQRMLYIHWYNLHQCWQRHQINTQSGEASNLPASAAAPSLPLCEQGTSKE
jgi:hypothetical protein